jgi:N-methylhydantoinase A/oxoprolinase/acetone carboxylase beta subunit
MNLRPRTAIGIDTGGTYTDAVLIDLDAQRVLARAKALTTRGDLVVGVAEALAAVCAEAPEAAASAGYVALSTTLATNAIVEGHGAPVGVILIGFDDVMAARAGIEAAIRGTPILRAAGGHDHAGDELTPLDEAAIADFLTATRGRVEAYAVASIYSVRNRYHEQRAGALVASLSGRPVTLSADLAQALDAPRRALTAALNARIVGRIAALIGAVRQATAAHGLDAPLLVVKGDGTLATAAQIAERPIETILSGPAASSVGARFLSGRDDLVVADIGGTTTDIGVLEGGWPRLDRTGALVGGHRTMVQAIDMRTFGLGGDSEIGFDAAAGRFAVRANRIWPLALLGARFPGVIDSLEAALADPQGVPYAGRFALRLPGEARGLAARDAAVLDRIGPAPRPLGTLVRGPLERRALERLVAQGLVALAGFTPSDAAHVLRLQGQWSRAAAVAGALLLRRTTQMLGAGDREDQARAVAAEVFDAVVRASGRAIVASLAGVPLGGDAGALVDAAVAGDGRVGRLAVSLAPVLPVVGVGGPAPVFYPEMCRRLGAQLLLPEHGDVANAIGAAVAAMRARGVAEVTSLGMGEYRIHHRGAPVPVAGGAAALAEARRLAAASAQDAAREAGLRGGTVAYREDRVDVPGEEGDTGLIAAIVIAEIVAPPSDNCYHA